MKIHINDTPTQIDSNVTLTDILAKYTQNGPFAVALNAAFVPKEHYHETILKEGDMLEIVTPMQGG